MSDSGDLVTTYESGNRKALIRKLMRGFSIECYIDEKCVHTGMQMREDDAELIADAFVGDESNYSNLQFLKG